MGYNTKKPGRNSHHPWLAVVADTRLCPDYRWRPGNTGFSTQWIEAMEESVRWIGRLPWLNRDDVGFCSEQTMAWNEQDNESDYLFKLRLTKNLKRAVAQLKEEDWQGCDNFGILQTAELKLQLSGWSHTRRVVVERRLICYTGGENDGEFWSHAKYEY